MGNDIQIVPSGNELEKQFEFINSLIEQHRSSAIALVNNEAMQMYWDIVNIFLRSLNQPIGAQKWSVIWRTT